MRRTPATTLLILGKRQGFPARITRVLVMPESNGRLTALPAQKHGLAARWMNAGEVDQSAVHVLDENAQLLERFDLGHKLAAQLRRALRVTPGFDRSGARTVRASALLGLTPRWLRRQKLDSQLHHPLDAAGNFGQGLLSLIDREMSHPLSPPAWIHGMATRIIVATLACAASLLTLTACGEREEPLGELPPDFPTTVQGAGEEPFVAESAPDRIVALDAGVALTAWELGGNVVGSPSDAVDPSIEVITGADDLIDLDAVRALSPDLIVATSATDLATIAALRDDPGVPIFVAPALSVDDVVRSAYELGLLLGDPVLAREFAGDLQTDIDETARKIANEPAVRVFVDTGFRVPPDLNVLFFDVLRRAGGVFVPDAAVAGRSVDADDLAAAAPDVYLATIESRVTLETLQANEDLNALPAVVSRRVFVIERESLTVGGPDIVSTLEELVALLHEDVS